jgi:hypothetical protein
MSMIDFVDNYNFEVQNEVQSMHWHSYQISILLDINFHYNSTFDLYDENSRILTKYHFYIANDHKHDSEFVQHCFKLHWQYMVEKGYSTQWHWVWNDEYTSQFKNNKP